MLCGRISSFSLKLKFHYHKTAVSITFLRKYSKLSAPRNPYDVLGVENTSSSKDIRKAYIKLCKELHPDKKPHDVTQHKKFVELNNAYSALINESSRKQVDDSLKNPFKAQGFSYPPEAYYYRNTSGPLNRGKNTETEEKDIPWYEREVYRKQYEEYYNRQKQNAHVSYLATQSVILYGCFILLVIGCALYYAAYSYSRIVLKRVDKKSKKIKENCDELRQNVEKRREAMLENFKK